MLFIDSAEGVDTILRPYWSEATGDRANVVQAQADMLEIVPPGTSKGNGVKMLLDHLGVSPKEVRTKEVVLDLFLIKISQSSSSRAGRSWKEITTLLFNIYEVLHDITLVARIQTSTCGHFKRIFLNFGGPWTKKQLVNKICLMLFSVIWNTLDKILTNMLPLLLCNSVVIS